MPLLRNYYVRSVLISWRSAVEPVPGPVSPATPRPGRVLPRRAFRVDAGLDGSRAVNAAGSPLERQFRTDLR